MSSIVRLSFQAKKRNGKIFFIPSFRFFLFLLLFKFYEKIAEVRWFIINQSFQCNVLNIYSLKEI